MQKIIPIYAAKIGDNAVNRIVGINTNRIHNDIMVQSVSGNMYTKITYYLDPAKNPTETLLITDNPNIIYSQMDGSFNNSGVSLSLVGGGTISIPTADIIYCHMDATTFERCSIDAIVNSRRNLYKLDMTFMELLSAVNSPDEA